MFNSKENITTMSIASDVSFKSSSDTGAQCKYRLYETLYNMMRKQHISPSNMSTCFNRCLWIQRVQKDSRVGYRRRTGYTGRTGRTM